MINEIIFFVKHLSSLKRKIIRIEGDILFIHYEGRLIFKAKSPPIKAAIGIIERATL